MNEKIEEIFKDASERVKKQKEKQEEYWIKRSEQKYLDGEKKGLELAQLLQRNYKQTIRNIQSEIYDFYGRYAKEGKIDLKEAKKLLSNSELTTFIESTKDIAEYAKQTNDEDYKKKLKLLRIKSQVTRLEELKTNIEYELSKLTNEGEQQLKEYLEDIYEDSYYRTIFDVEQNTGLAVSYARLNQKLIEKAVSRKYQDTNYSKAIWKNKDTLFKILEQKIPQGLSAGWNPKKLAKIVDKQLNTGYNNTVRLIRTEYNLLMNEVTADGYKECGINQYQILATLDSKTSEICQEMDLKIFDLKDKAVGINYPPFHPNCRTTTIPYFEADEIDKEYGIGSRIARDKKGKTYEVPANMNYKEWKQQQVDNESVPNFYKNIVKNEEQLYTKDEIMKIANETSKIANKYTNNESKWSGNIIESTRFVTAKRWNCDIEVENYTSPHAILHEQLHAHSISYYGSEAYKKYRRIEEASIELLTKEIGKKENIIDIPSDYDKWVDNLIQINDKVKIEDNNLKFAQTLFNIPVIERLDFIESKIQKYLIDKDINEAIELNKLLEVLYGK